MKMVTLESSDHEMFQVEEGVARGSQIIKNMIEDNCVGPTIPLSEVSAKTLARVIEYLKKHVNEDEAANDNNALTKELEDFDKEFVDVDQETLFNLIHAANYLEIKSLLDLTCKTVADMMTGKTPEQKRQIFNIKNDFTQEEEEAVQKKNAWAFFETFSAENFNNFM